MSFQAYIDNIKAKTGKTPDDFRILANKNGILKDGVKVMDIVKWLKKDFQLGHGHSMAIVMAFKMKGWIKPPDKKKTEVKKNNNNK